MTDSFSVQFSCKGKTSLTEATLQTTAADLIQEACRVLHLPHDNNLKLLYKGKRLNASNVSAPVFTTVPKTMPKIMVLVTAQAAVTAMNAKRSDPTIRGFDQEANNANRKPDDAFWGPDYATQNKNYKFCRFEVCDWQSFGHRPVDSTPHAFAARALLEQLATDPGIQAVLQTRQLVVGTLGEMDPIDDRLMQRTQQHGGCLLGYNTNGGQRIDVKLRTDDLQGFRPYAEIAATLIHELSHNWVGEHNLLFWTNYAQMRCQYLYTHARSSQGYIVRGKTTAQLAQLPPNLLTAKQVYEHVMMELSRDMAQHGLHPRMLAAGLWQHVLDLERQAQSSVPTAASSSTTPTTGQKSARELALEAAERRARENQERKDHNNNDTTR